MQTTPIRKFLRTGRGSSAGRWAGRAAHDVALTRLTAALLRPWIEETDNPVLKVGLRRAAAEAESLAWLSPVPLLVLPLLFEEKARNARRYATRQAELREASREWVGFAE